MNNPEVNNTLYSSCGQYYEYLNVNARGQEETRPLGVTYEEDCCRARLRVRFVPQESGNLQFRFANRIYTTEQVAIIEIDEVRRSLLLQFDQSDFALVNSTPVEDVALIDDLKWLVERVRIWYLENKKNFALPSVGNAMQNSISFSHGIKPSAQQVDAINAILTEPVTYIWGAPGTGKTKFVLSYAVANLFKNALPVLILAPTNCALDQTLSGILPVLEKMEMDLSRVIRLGAASGNLPARYASICENAELRRNTDEIDAQLAALYEQQNSYTKKNEILLLRQLQDELKALQKKSLTAQNNLARSSTNQLSLFDEPVTDDSSERSSLFMEELAETKAAIDRLGGKIAKLNDEIVAEPLLSEEQALAIETKIGELERRRQMLSDRTNPAKKCENKLIVACTLDNCIGNKIAELPIFRHIFLDEAAFACMAKTLPLLTTDVPLTLLGDHMQLPPVCEADEQALAASNNEMFFWAQSALQMESIFCHDLSGLKRRHISNRPAMFEQIKKHTLTASYRFGSRLAGALDSFVYKSGLSSALKNETGIYYLDVPAPLTRPLRQNGAGSRANPAEAEAVAELIARLNGDFAVLTPYREQVKEISKTAPDLARDGKLMTIHKAQGSEWDTVVISIADTGNMWFTNTQKRHLRALELINTAVSRAKKSLVLLCDYAFWIRQNNQFITELLKISQKLK